MYRIEYGSKSGGQAGRIRPLILTGIFFLLFCVGVNAFWPEGRVLLRTLLIPGDPDTTLQAAEVFAAELGSGYAVVDAVRNFCSAVWKNGYSG